MTSHDPFATTIHKTNTWLAEINAMMRWDDRQRAWSALRAVLHALRDRLTAEEAASLGAQLPLLVRGAYYENWSPSHAPRRMRTRQDFLARVRSELHGCSELEAETLTNVVLRVLVEHLSLGEVEHVARLLPRQIAELWPA
jgi:uncharacterized protein (DUF2267 family)